MPKERFVHAALLSMEVDADHRAPGGAITVALCGSWEHEPPCPLAPHHTRAERAGDEVRLRVLFAAEPDDEPRVRAMIDDVLARGTGATPEGRTVMASRGTRPPPRWPSTRTRPGRGGRGPPQGPPP